MENQTLSSAVINTDNYATGPVAAFVYWFAIGN
jgi:hypothetical protein